MALLDGGDRSFGFVLTYLVLVDVEIHHEPTTATVSLRKFFLDRPFKRSGNALRSLDPIVDRVQCGFVRAGLVLIAQLAACCERDGHLNVFGSLTDLYVPVGPPIGCRR